MTIGDITILEQSSTMSRGSRTYRVVAGATVINPGEPVARVLGATAATACATNAGQVGTDYIVGVAQTTSTNSSTLNGVVDVLPLTSQTTYLIAPKVAATFATQALYDALVGKRVLIDLTASTYTLLASDSSGNGCVIMPLNVAQYPGKVAFAFRGGLSDLS